jgi:hypothetical protein
MQPFELPRQVGFVLKKCNCVPSPLVFERQGEGYNIKNTEKSFYTAF